MNPQSLLTLCVFHLYSFCLLAQENGNVYFASSFKWRHKKAAVFPYDSGYVLLQSATGLLGDVRWDTLVPKAGHFSSKYHAFYMTTEGAYFISHSTTEKIPPVMLDAFPACHPTTNAFLNWHYANHLNNVLDREFNKKDVNVLMEKGVFPRARHEVEMLDKKHTRKKNNVFERYCPSDFRPLADSVYKERRQLLEQFPNVHPCP